MKAAPLLNLSNSTRCERLSSRTILVYTNLALSLLILLVLCPHVRALDNESLAARDEQPPTIIWPTEMSSASDSPLLDLMQTISGKKPEEKTTRLLNGVVEIHTTQNGVRFIRSDYQFLDWNTGTVDGDRLFRNWQDISQQAEKLLGPDAGSFMMGLRSIKAKGAVVEVDDTMHDCLLRFTQPQKSKFVCLESLRLREIRLSLEREQGQLWIKHMNGVEALLRVGELKIPLQLREFSRKKNKNGQTVLTFGFIPTVFSPLRALLEPCRISFIMNKQAGKKQDSHEAQVKDKYKTK